MPLLPIINSVVCVVGTLAGVLFAGASIISIANMTVPWRVALLVAAMLIPVMFVVSGIGTWFAYGRASQPFTIGLVALPWVYGLVFVVVMYFSFDM